MPLGRLAEPLIWRDVCQVGDDDFSHQCWLIGGGVVGWVGGGPAGCARRAVRLIFAGWDRRTMVRRGEPLSSIGRGQPFGGGGLLKRFSRVPRALPGRHRPSRRDRRCQVSGSLDLGDRPGEAGEFAGGRDRDDRAPLGALLEPCPGAMQTLLG
jgi:hypothetical protein